MITLRLEDDDAELLRMALGKMPYELIAPLYDKVRRQVNEQRAAAPADDVQRTPSGAVALG